MLSRGEKNKFVFEKVIVWNLHNKVKSRLDFGMEVILNLESVPQINKLNHNQLTPAKGLKIESLKVDLVATCFQAEVTEGSCI